MHSKLVAAFFASAILAAAVPLHAVSPCKAITNHAPLAADDFFDWPAGAIPLDVLRNDSDPDGDPLRIANVSSPVIGGSVQIASDQKSMTFTPAAGATSARFTYTVDDGKGLTAQAVVFIDAAVSHPTAAVETKCTYATCSFTVSANPATNIAVYEWYIYRAGTSRPANPVKWWGRTYSYTFPQIGNDQAGNKILYVVEVHTRYASGEAAVYIDDAFHLGADPVHVDFGLHTEVAFYGGLYTAVRLTDSNYTWDQASFSVDWGDGRVNEFSRFGSDSPVGAVLEHGYLEPGTYNVTIVVSPTAGGTAPGRRTREIVITNDPPRPAATWTVAPSGPSYRATFDPSSTLDDRDLTYLTYPSPSYPKTYTWTFSDGRIFSSASNDSADGKISIGFKGGPHQVTLQATDVHGATGSRTYDFEIPNNAPVALFRFDCSAGLHCKLDATDTLDDNVKEYRWRSGTQAWTTTSPRSEVTFASYGRQSIELTVADEAGATSTTYRTAQVRPPVTGPRLAFYYVPRCRLYDSGNGGLANGATVRLPVVGNCAVPSSAVAVEAALAIDHPTAAGHLYAWPAATTRPESTVLNFAPGGAISNNATVTLNEGAIEAGAYVSGPEPANARLIVDVAGFWAPASVVATSPQRGPLYLYPADWTVGGERVVAASSAVTRVGTGATSGDYGAALVQGEAWQPTSRGHVTLFGYADAPPPVSTFNLPLAGQPVSGFGIVPAAANGVFDGLAWQFIGTSPSAQVAMTWTVLGLFEPAKPPEIFPLPLQREYVPIEPCRVMDSRFPQEYGDVRLNYRAAVLVGGNCGIPRNPSAVRANITILNATTEGVVRAVEGRERLWTTPGTVTAYGVMSRLANRDIYGDLPGGIHLTTESAAGGPMTVDYVVDVVGYFVDRTPR